MVWYKRELPLVISTLCGLFMVFEYAFIFPDPVTNVANELQNFVTIIAAFALGTGAISILRYHSFKVIQKKARWGYSIITIALLLTMIGAGLIQGPRGPLVLWLYVNVTTPAMGMFKAFRGFFVASASYRAFKVKTVEATILMVTAIILLFVGAPISTGMWPVIGRIGDWILNVPNVAGYRGLIIGVALAMVGLSIRILLGQERGYLTGAGGT